MCSNPQFPADLVTFTEENFSHLLKKFLIQNFIFGAVNGTTPLSLRIIIVCQSLGCFRKIFKL